MSWFDNLEVISWKLLFHCNSLIIRFKLKKKWFCKAQEDYLTCYFCCKNNIVDQVLLHVRVWTKWWLFPKFKQKLETLYIYIYGCSLTSFESLSISAIWWSMASTFFPQRPRKPVCKFRKKLTVSWINLKTILTIFSRNRTPTVRIKVPLSLAYLICFLHILSGNSLTNFSYSFSPSPVSQVYWHWLQPAKYILI